MITTNVEQLVINKMSQAQYDAAKAAGTLSDDEIYLTPDDGSEEEYVPTSRTINGKTLEDDIELSALDVGASEETHVHGNITSGGDITATAPTIASGDKLVINDESAGRITNGPSFGTDTAKFLRNDGQWAEPDIGAEQNVFYGTCSTSAGTAAKTSTISGFSLTAGYTVKIRFQYANTAANPTLNVSSTGAKSIVRYGTTTAGTTEGTSWSAGAVVSFTYYISGTTGYWVMNDYKNTSLSDLSGTVPVSKGGTGATTASEALGALGGVSLTTVRNIVNRTTNVDAADTNYTTCMARGIVLSSVISTPNINGAITFQYE